MYFLAWGLHVGCVVASVALFAFRGALMLARSPLLDSRTMRVLPHAIDTLLLAGAVWLAVLLRQYPFVHGWLTAKTLALVAYVVLGSIALRRGRSRRQRALALAGALSAVAYIVAVAVTKDPAPWQPLFSPR